MAERRTKGMIFETPMGWVGIASSERGLCAAVLPRPTEAEAWEALVDAVGAEPELSPDEPFLSKVASRLVRFYAGEAADFDDIPLDDSIGTEFQRRVWNVVRRIPRGETMTYGEVAGLAGRPGAARAVGQAMSRNPWPPIVPCHRVVGSGGKLVGFGGGLALKEKMLKLEGASLPVKRSRK